MKRLQYFVFACLLFMSFTVSVNAVTPGTSDFGGTTKCNYVWNNTLFSYEKDENGDPIPVDYTFSLETEKGSNRLTIANAPGNFEIRYKNAIYLNSDGSCPTISIYSQAIFGKFLIYDEHNTCTSEIVNFDSRCSPDLTPIESSSDTSTANDAGSNGQFRLADSDENSCQYEQPIDLGSNVVYNTITINREGNGEVSGTCDARYSTSCRVAFDIQESEFYSNNTFTCAPYIFARTSTTSSNNPSTTYTIYELGREGDTDVAEGTNENWQRPNAIDTSGWNGSIECSDIFKINEEGSFGWMLNTILGYIKVIAPILVVLLSAIDFIKAVFGFDEKAMKEAQHKLIIRLIAAVALFLIPQLIQLIMNFINVSLDPACFLQ